MKNENKEEVSVDIRYNDENIIVVASPEDAKDMDLVYVFDMRTGDVETFWLSSGRRYFSYMGIYKDPQEFFEYIIYAEDLQDDIFDSEIRIFNLISS